MPTIYYCSLRMNASVSALFLACRAIAAGDSRARPCPALLCPSETTGTAPRCPEKAADPWQAGAQEEGGERGSSRQGGCGQQLSKQILGPSCTLDPTWSPSGNQSYYQTTPTAQSSRDAGARRDQSKGAGEAPREFEFWFRTLVCSGLHSKISINLVPGNSIPAAVNPARPAPISTAPTSR